MNFNNACHIEFRSSPFLLTNRPLSRGGHFESQGNKKLCFCTSSLALNERLDVQNLLFEHCVIKVYTNCFSGLLYDRETRRRRRRERHQTKGLMSRTITVHVRYNRCTYLPSSAKQQREMTKFCVVHETWTTTANFSYFHLELNAVVAYLA